MLLLNYTIFLIKYNIYLYRLKELENLVQYFIKIP